MRYLMMAAGSDGTALFNEYHAWVNGHAMLAVCSFLSLLQRLSFAPPEMLYWGFGAGFDPWPQSRDR